MAPFLVYFDGRGIKTPISVAFALLFVSTFKMDIVTDLVNIFAQRETPFQHGPEATLLRHSSSLVVVPP